MVKRIVYLLLSLCTAFLLTSCGGGDSAVKDASAVDTAYKVYYVDMSKPAVKSESRGYVSENTYELIGECIQALETKPDKKNGEAAIQEPLKVIKYGFNEEGKQADIYFNSAYYEMSKEKEILVRAAIVNTLTQFDTLIDYVAFYVNDAPLTDKNGSAKVMMASDFIDSTSADIKNLNEETLTLYFASTDGTQLASENVRVHYKNTASIESVVMERLIAGPLSDTLNKTCSSDTKLNSITVENGLCTVDMSSKFLETVDNQGFNIKVYSVVNSLCALDDVEKVQILINGKAQNLVKDGVNISAPLTMNEDIIVKPVDAPPAVTTEENGETAASVPNIGPDSPGASRQESKK